MLQYIIKTKLTWSLILSLFTIILNGNTTLLGAEEGWPRQIKTSSADIIIYQPQPETFEGNKLTARAAVGVTLKDVKEPVFGAIWIDSRVETDRDAGIVTVVDINVNNIRFPDATDEQVAKLKKILEREIPKWELDISLENLTATLAAVEKEQAAAKNLKNDPPKIIFSPEPAVLLSYDGEPQLRKIENSDMMRVINAPLPVVLETSSKTYYLNGGEIWYKAADAKGPWQHIDKPPKKVAAQVKKGEDTRASAGAADESKKIPKIIVSTKPAELLVAEGEPKFSPISSTDLLYMSNSESDILLEIPTQKYFVLLSGRWYTTTSLDGNWKYVASDKLPPDFLKIPYESANGHLLAFVAGTDQAKEMVMDNLVPQTSTVKRKDVSLKVIYDGDPKFEKIKGTKMAYAVNTSYAVLKIENKFYCCHEGVWYVSDKPTDSWAVATKVPDDVQDIPPDNPHYNVKYVYIYDSTPDVVYVGYTPAYMGSYVYGPCVVYGTGYYYYPWWGPVYYYPRPCTWGFHVRYNPWTGWCYGMSYSSGPFRITVGFGGGGYYGWYGPGRYRPYPYRSYRKTEINVNRNININTGDINIGDRNTMIERNEKNIYNRKENRNKNVQRPGSKDRVNPKAVKNKPNNVYTDKKGNVHRRTEKGWESRKDGRWASEKSVSQERVKKRPDSGKSGRISQDKQKMQPKAKKAPSQLNREHRARERGNVRSKGTMGSRGGRRR